MTEFLEFLWMVSNTVKSIFKSSKNVDVLVLPGVAVWAACTVGAPPP